MSTAEAKVQYVTNESGEKTAVIVPISEYEALMEDLQDLAVIAERRDEEVVAHEDVVKDLRASGLAAHRKDVYR